MIIFFFIAVPINNNIIVIVPQCSNSVARLVTAVVITHCYLVVFDDVQLRCGVVSFAADNGAAGRDER